MKIDKTMKRWVFILIAALAIFLTADLCARERGVKFSGGTDLVSTYVWRGVHDGIALSFCESEELPYLKDIQKLIGKNIPVIKEHPFVTADGLKAQEIKTEEIKAKTKENKIYRGSRTNGDFWRRKKRTSQNNTPKGVGR